MFSQVSGAVDRLALRAADANGRMAKSSAEQAAAAELAGSRTRRAFTAAGTAGLGVAAGIVAAGYAAVKSAGNWQESMTQLVTGAGEAQKNIDMVSQGLLKMAGDTGTSATQLAQGMYMVESAGFRGAQGLSVMRAAAEGAKVGNADMETVANAVTSALNAYKLSGTDAAKVTSQLVATVASGKMRMQDLAGALGSVLPAASTAGISLSEVGAAIATMTSKGLPAADAATYLRQTILQLSNPTGKAKSEMAALGLNAIDVSKNLGSRGLAGTLQVLTDAIKSKMGPAGTVILDTLRKASGSTQGFQKALKSLSPTQQTFIGALADMVGGTKSMQAALSLTADMGTFRDDTKAIGDAAQQTTDQVRGFDKVQEDLNFKVEKAKESLRATAIALGTALIPAVTQLVQVVTRVLQPVTQWVQGHQKLTVIILGTVAALGSALAVIAVAIRVVPLLRLAILGIGSAMNVISMSPVGLVLMVLVTVALLVITHWSTVKKWLIAAWDAISTAARTLASTVGGFFAGLWRDVTGWVTRLWRGIVATLTRLRSDVLLSVAALVTGFVSGVARIWRDVTGFFTRIRSDVIGAVRNLGASVVDYFTGLPGRVMAALGSLVGRLRDFGTRIIQAVAAGIRSAAGAVGSALSGVLSSIPGGGLLKGALKAVGLATGGIVTSPTLAVVGESGPEAVIPLSKPFGSPRALGALTGAGGAQVYVDLRGSQVMSERDLDLLVEKVGYHLATSVLPSAGVKVFR